MKALQHLREAIPITINGLSAKVVLKLDYINRC